MDLNIKKSHKNLLEKFQNWTFDDKDILFEAIFEIPILRGDIKQIIESIVNGYTVLLGKF